MLEFRPGTDHPLQLDLEDDGSGPVRLIVGGDVDTVSGRRLHRTVIDILRRRRPARIELDLGCAALHDPAGIRALLLCHADAAQVDCRIVFVRLPAAAHQALRAARLLEWSDPTGAC
jgi:anti-anti-sigma regulatory factor